MEGKYMHKYMLNYLEDNKGLLTFWLIIWNIVVQIMSFITL